MNMKPPFGSQLDLGDLINQGLVGCWLMNEGAGRIVANSVNQQKSPFVGSQIGWQPTNYGSAVVFVDDAIDAGAALYDQCAEEMTIAARCKPMAHSTHGRLIDKYPGPTIHRSLVTENWGFYGTIGGTSRDATWGVFSPEGVWVHAAFVLGRGFQHLYLNGLLVSGSLSGGPFSGVYSTGPGVAAYIGNRASDMTRQYEGLISTIVVYNRALTPIEIARLYREEFAGIARDPIEIWGTLGGGAPASPTVAPIRLNQRMRRA